MKCEKCGGTGYIWGLDGMYETVRECSCLTEARTRARLSRSGLSALTERYRFDNYTADEPWQKNLLQKAMEYDGRGWFFAGGQSGAGKTHVCTAIADKLIKDGCACRYMLWRQESPKLKASINSEHYHLQLSVWKDVRLLYIDDLFKGGASDADIRLAFDIIDARYREDLPTIISSEYYIAELAEIDEAIAGRIYGAARGNIVNIRRQNERNWRLK